MPGFVDPHKMPELQASAVLIVSFIASVYVVYWAQWIPSPFSSITWLILWLIPAGGIGYLLRKIAKGGRYDVQHDLSKKVVIVTGANAGIGYEAAVKFALMGAHVIMACRSEQRGNSALASAKSATNGKGKLEFMKLDLANFASIRQFVDDFKAKNIQLDILLNNAGVMMCPYTLTADGYEMQVGTNHIGHFLLTTLLLDKIKETKGRVVNVSSAGHAFAGNGVDWENVHKEEGYDPTKHYGYSKAANILFTVELERRLQGTGCHAYAVHPGAVMTELARHFNQALVNALRPVLMLLLKFPEEGCQTSLFCSLSPDAKPGKYHSDCAQYNTTDFVMKSDEAKKLWEITERWVNVK